MKPSPPRQELIDLAKKIRDARDQGNDADDLVAQLQPHVSYPRLDELFDSDWPAEVIVDYAVGWKAEWPKLTHSEMVELVQKIINAEGNEAEINLMIHLFDSNCHHPAKNGLIYYSDDYFRGDPTVEKIVEKAMSGEA